MVESTVEETVNVDMDSKNKKNLKAEFLEQFGQVDFKMCAEAQKAIKEGTDFYLTSENFRRTHPELADAGRISGQEIKAWGLDLDTLLVPEEPGTVAYYAKRIL